MRIPKPKRKPKPRRAKRVSSVKRVTDLWSLLVKVRAGYRSQLSGIQCRVPGTGSDLPIADSHHILGKKNLWLKLDPRNGICLTHREHFYDAHALDPAKNHDTHRKIVEWLSDGVYSELEELRDKPGKPNLAEVEAELTRQIEYYEKLNRRLP